MADTKSAETSSILPQDPDEAARLMIRITDELSALLQREADAVAMQDIMALTLCGNEKEKAADIYARAAKELQDRIPQFKGRIGTDLLNRLEDAQITLGEVSRANLETLNKYHKA
ncbi:MAG: hypothetical protein EOM26_06105 [Alphaproteobacteria bacterium]|nr:hypothetical protein [Alphaproteobacteria bacterium]